MVHDVISKRGISRHVKVLQPTTNCDYKMEGLDFSLEFTVVKGGLKIRTKDLILVWKAIDPCLQPRFRNWTF